MVFEVHYCTCGGGFLILRRRNLSKQCLLRFLCLSIKILLIVGAVKRFKDCNTKLDHAELLSFSGCTVSLPLPNSLQKLFQYSRSRFAEQNVCVSAHVFDPFMIEAGAKGSF